MIALYIINLGILIKIGNMYSERRGCIETLIRKASNLKKYFNKNCLTECKNIRTLTTEREVLKA